MASEPKSAAEWLEHELLLWEPYLRAEFRDGGAADSARQTLLMLRDAKAELDKHYLDARGWDAIERAWREGKYR